jgi:hypothetical protein
MYAIPKGRDAVAPWPGRRSAAAPYLDRRLCRGASNRRISSARWGGATLWVCPAAQAPPPAPPGQHLVRAES